MYIQNTARCALASHPRFNQVLQCVSTVSSNGIRSKYVRTKASDICRNTVLRVSTWAFCMMMMMMMMMMRMRINDGPVCE